MKEPAHNMDSSRESIPEFRDRSQPLTDNFNQSENDELKIDVSLPPSSTHMSFRMVVIIIVDMDLTTTVHLLLHRLDPKPKQGFERTGKQEGTVVSYY